MQFSNDIDDELVKENLSNSKNKPSQVVKFNRRLNLKKLSQLNGENLHLIGRNLLGSDRNLSMRGKIAASQRNLKQELVEWFAVLNWKVERCTRIQNHEYKNLVRLHNEKRNLDRRKYDYHPFKTNERDILQVARFLYCKLL